MTLTEFLTARLDEDGAVAKAAQADAWSETAGIHGFEDPWPSHFAFAEHLTPARVLADVEAKRRIVEWVTRSQAAAGDPPGFEDEDAAALTQVLRLLALPYADHEDFDESWRP